MRINRRFIYWGIFLIAVGGVLVAADVQAIDTATFADALRRWPLALVAIGLGLVARRTPVGLPAGLLGAAIPGLLLGGGLAALPRLAVDCGSSSPTQTTVTQAGTFDGPAGVSVTTGCGTLVVDTAHGSGWNLQAGNTRGRTPLVDASARSLSVDAGGHTGLHWFDSGRDAWQVTLPTSRIDDLSLVVNAGEGTIGLTDADIGRLDLTTNAGKTSVDLSATSVESIVGTVNAGLLSIRLPGAANFEGTLQVNAGEIQLCVPSTLGLHIHHTGVLGAFSVHGQKQTGSDYVTAGPTSFRANLDITVNLGNVDIDPIGGCK